MQNIFKRYERKYLVTEAQNAKLQKAISQHMIADQYGEYLVQNLYYDTENWDVIRASVEKPAYKEKMRLRCYGEAAYDSDLYLELKKKFNGIVFKRRIAITSQSLENSSVHAVITKIPSQISKEVDYYLKSNGVAVKIYIAYRRAAFSGIEDEGLRITFDTDICFRLYNLSFSNPDTGQRVLPQGKILMEIKTLDSIPLWMAGILSENGIYPISFSKFGTCYTDYIHKQICEEREVKTCA